MIYYYIAYNMCLVFKALCYLGSDLISPKDSKLFQFKELILTQLSCVVVYLRALFYDPFCLFFIYNLSLVLFLNVQYLTCCMWMICKYANHLTWTIVYLLFCVLKSVYPMSKPGWCLTRFKWMKTRQKSYVLLLNEFLTCSIFQNSQILTTLVLNSVVQLGTWALLSTALFCCISMSWMSVGMNLDVSILFEICCILMLSKP